MDDNGIVEHTRGVIILKTGQHSDHIHTLRVQSCFAMVINQIHPYSFNVKSIMAGHAKQYDAISPLRGDYNWRAQTISTITTITALMIHDL